MRAIDVIRKVAPKAKPVYVAAFENGDEQLQAAGITTPLRMAHFLAQVLHETGGLTILEESLFYTHVSALRSAWSGRFAPMSDAEASAYLRNPKKLAAFVYNGRMGNHAGTDDGFIYRGRGILQTTGRENYRRIGQKCNVDFEGSPDLVISEDHALKPALAEWTEGGLNSYADKDDLMAISRAINIGNPRSTKMPNGYISRKAFYQEVRPLIGRVDFVNTGEEEK